MNRLYFLYFLILQDKKMQEKTKDSKIACRNKTNRFLCDNRKVVCPTFAIHWLKIDYPPLSSWCKSKKYWRNWDDVIIFSIQIYITGTSTDLDLHLVPFHLPIPNCNPNDKNIGIRVFPILVLKLGEFI